MNVFDLIKRFDVDVNGVVQPVPISLDFSTLSAEETNRGLELGGEDPMRVSAAFVALKANQTMGLSDEDLIQVVDQIADFIAGDTTNLVLENA